MTGEVEYKYALYCDKFQRVLEYHTHYRTVVVRGKWLMDLYGDFNVVENDTGKVKCESVKHPYLKTKGRWEKISQSEVDALKTALEVARDYDGKISLCNPYKFINNALFIEELENFLAEIARRYHIMED